MVRFTFVKLGDDLFELAKKSMEYEEPNVAVVPPVLVEDIFLPCQLFSM